MLNNKRLLSNTIFYSIGEIIPRILSFILLPILTLYLTTEEYGIISYTNSVMTFVFVIASLSLNTYLLREFYIEKDENRRKNIVGSIFYFILLFNFFLVLLQWIFFPSIISYFKISVPFYPFFILAILNNFFDVISIIPLVLYRVNENAKGFLIVSLSRTILQYFLVLVLVVHYKLGLEGSYYGRLLVNIPYVFVYFYYIKKNGTFTLDLSIVKKALKFSLPLLPGGISYILIALSDRIILERYETLDLIGIYSVAFTLALALNIIIQALYKAIEPILFKEFSGNNFESINSVLYKSYLCLIFIGAFGVAIYSKEIFTLAVSKDFLSGYKIVPYLVVSVVLSGINIYLDMLLIANNKQKLVSYTTILSGILSVTLNLILIPILGFYGAIIASITAFLVVNVICHFNVFIYNRYFISQIVLISLVIIIPYCYDYFIISSNLLTSISTKMVMVLGFSLLSMKLFNINISQLKGQFIKK